LHPIKQMVAFPNSLHVQLITLVNRHTFHHPTDFINPAMNSSSGNQLAKFFVQEFRGNAECFAHIGQCDCLVGFEELVVGADSDLSDEIFFVGAQVLVC
jgi:hypothetical protein